MEVSRSIIPYTQLPVWFTCTTTVQQKETGMGTGQDDELELSQGKTLSHHTLFWKKKNKPKTEKTLISRRIFNIRGLNSRRKYRNVGYGE